MKMVTTTSKVCERDDQELQVGFNGCFSNIPATSPSSPSASSSSSEFEFTVSLSPTTKKPSHLCPADELFYKGQLLPLQLSPRLDMVRALLASSSSSSSSDSNTSRNSNGSSNDFSSVNDCDSSRPSSAMEDDELRKQPAQPHHHHHPHPHKKSKYFSLSLFSSVFNRKEKAGNVPTPAPPPTCKKIGASAKEVIKKYVNIVKKVKPLYDRLAPRNQMHGTGTLPAPKSKTSAILKQKPVEESFQGGEGRGRLSYQSSFSGNLRQRYPNVARVQSRSCVVSCPSSMRSSPSRSGVGRASSGSFSDLPSVSSMTSSMEELQSAIQGAIAHCKSSLSQPSHKKATAGVVAGKVVAE